MFLITGPLSSHLALSPLVRPAGIVLDPVRLSQTVLHLAGHLVTWPLSERPSCITHSLVIPSSVALSTAKLVLHQRCQINRVKRWRSCKSQVAAGPLMISDACQIGGTYVSRTAYALHIRATTIQLNLCCNAMWATTFEYKPPPALLYCVLSLCLLLSWMEMIFS